MIAPLAGKSGGSCGQARHDTPPGGANARRPPASAPASCIRPEGSDRTVGACAPGWARSGSGPRIGTGRRPGSLALVPRERAAVRGESTEAVAVPMSRGGACARRTGPFSFAPTPSYRLHFTPTYSSWPNQVERWFGLLSEKALQRGTCYNVSDLVEQVRAYTRPQRCREAVRVGRHGPIDPRQSGAFIETPERYVVIDMGTCPCRAEGPLPEESGTRGFSLPGESAITAKRP